MEDPRHIFEEAVSEYKSVEAPELCKGRKKESKRKRKGKGFFRRSKQHSFGSHLAFFFFHGLCSSQIFFLFFPSGLILTYSLAHFAWAQFADNTHEEFLARESSIEWKASQRLRKLRVKKKKRNK